MNRKEAKQILFNQLEKMKQLSYEKLRNNVISNRSEEIIIISETGKKYYVEFFFFWECFPEKTIGTLGLIRDDSWISSFFPISSGFLTTPKSGPCVGKP